jgi:hypothetical protein
MTNSQTLQFAADLMKNQIEELDGRIDGMRAGLQMLEHTHHALRSALSTIEPRIAELKAEEPAQIEFDLTEDDE